MARQLLLDSSEFVIDRKSVVKEDLEGSTLIRRARGQLSACDILNGNNRLYTRSVWNSNLKEGSPLRQRMSKMRAFGLLEHPADGKVDLLSPISHALVEAHLNENGTVEGEIAIANTPEGRKLSALIDLGWNPLVSSRGFGTLVKDDQGRDIVQDDYVCEGWDVVMNPSFETAELVVTTESTARPTQTQKSLTENQPSTPPVTLPEPPVAPTLDQPKGPKPAKTSTNLKIMDAAEIRNKLAVITALDISNMEPGSYAEYNSQLENLHVNTDQWVAEEPATRTYKGQKLHQDIAAQQVRLSDSIQSPKVQAGKLQENQTKLLKVMRAVTETGSKLNGQLKESIKKNGELTKLSETLMTRGKAWKKVAEDLQHKVNKLEEKLKLATDGLDVFTQRYNSDLTTVGRKLITVEFRDKVTGPVKDALEKASTPKEIVTIREQLEGKKKTEPAAPGTTPPAASAAATEEKPAAPALESKTPAATAPIQESQSAVRIEANDKQTPIQIIATAGSPKSLSEALNITRRLSAGRPFTETAAAAK